MAVDPHRSRIEQDIEDCIALIQDLRSGDLNAPDVGERILVLQQWLSDLCTALGRLE